MLIASDNIIQIIGPKIKEARKNKKYTQEYVAEKIEISTDLLRNIENGRSIGSITTILNICNILEITPNTLFYELLETKDIVLNKELYEEIERLNFRDKELVKGLITHMKQNQIKK